ncbi:unnamed protein product [Prunus armeniaca]
MEMRLVACERMSGSQCSKKTPLSSCFVEQLVCNGDEACRLRAYVKDTTLEKNSIEFVLRGAACLQWRWGLLQACEINNKGNIKSRSSLMEVQEARHLLGAKLHKVSRLKLSDIGLPIVVGHQLLLVGSNSNNGLFSFFIEQIKVDFHLLAVLVDTAHLNAHGRDCDVTPGSSSTHFPSAPSSLFLRQSSTILLDASAWPLPCGYRGVDRCCLMPYFAKNAVICLPTNCVPLSVTIDCRQPNLQIMFFQMNRSTSASLGEDKASASIHLARDRLVALASITSSSILRGVLAHSRLEIADAESLLSKRSAPSVISTFAVVYLAENLERLWVLDASEMRPGV